MAIDGYSKHEFGEKLNTLVFPAQPIRSIENLHGRQNELSRIEKALFAPGRHVFIYGDRGVGKSSLAATAAAQYQSADADYIDVSCSPDTTLCSIVANIAYKAVNASRIKNIQNKKTLSASFKFLKADNVTENSLRDLHSSIHCLMDAVEVLREVAALHSENPIIVLDEFDRMECVKERNLFADLLKHLGDKQIKIKFIFTGVGKSLLELLGAHQSAIRQLETIELPRLSWDARWDIAISALKKFSIDIHRNIYVRIAAVSDGYPYYVHLITEKLLWHLFEREDKVTSVLWEDYHSALKDAIESISAELSKPYEMAINQKSGDYEEVLWSTADSEWIHTYLDSMRGSYQAIMQQLPHKEALDYDKYCSRIRSLKKPSFGAVLVSGNKPGLYSYRENMLRGYVRMQAEAAGITLIGETGGEEDKLYMKVKDKQTARVGTGYPKSRQWNYVDTKKKG